MCQTAPTVWVKDVPDGTHLTEHTLGNSVKEQSQQLWVNFPFTRRCWNTNIKCSLVCHHRRASASVKHRWRFLLLLDWYVLFQDLNKKNYLFTIAIKSERKGKKKIDNSTFCISFKLNCLKILCLSCKLMIKWVSCSLKSFKMNQMTAADAAS